MDEPRSVEGPFFEIPYILIAECDVALVHQLGCDELRPGPVVRHELPPLGIGVDGFLAHEIACHQFRDLVVPDRLDEFKRLVELVAASEITVKNAEEVVLREMLDEGEDPDTVIEREGLGKAEAGEVEGAVEEAIEENPDAVEDYHAGEEGALNFLVGQVMQKTGGSADPGTVNQLLRDRL